MKPPIILYEKYDLSIYPSVEHAESSIEIWDARDGLYVIYDSEGNLLDTKIVTISKNHKFLFLK